MKEVRIMIDKQYIIRFLISLMKITFEISESLLKISKSIDGLYNKFTNTLTQNTLKSSWACASNENPRKLCVCLLTPRKMYEICLVILFAVFLCLCF